MSKAFLRLTLILVQVAIAAGCNGDHTNITRPSAIVSQTPPNSDAARAHLEKVLDTMQSYSINKDSIDWASFRAQVLTAVGAARNVPDLYPAIETALGLLGDHESYYRPSSGGLIGPTPVGGCGGGAASPTGLPSTIGYIKVEMCDCQSTVANQFAQSIQDAIRRIDHPGIVGWIVDLRGNIGGNMWPMIAGVGPLLGEGIVGSIVYYNREYEREYRNGAALSLGEAFASVATPYRLFNENPKVAVLTDGGVSSAGEAVVVFFKGRPATRSFGTPTCGHHHLQEFFYLGPGTLALQTSQHADRRKQRYGGSIAPDEVVADPVETVRRAVAWLLDER